jgi:hypothetical protein
MRAMIGTQLWNRLVDNINSLDTKANPSLGMQLQQEARVNPELRSNMWQGLWTSPDESKAPNSFQSDWFGPRKK